MIIHANGVRPAHDSPGTEVAPEGVANCWRTVSYKRAHHESHPVVEPVIVDYTATEGCLPVFVLATQFQLSVAERNDQFGIHGLSSGRKNKRDRLCRINFELYRRQSVVIYSIALD